MSTKALRSAAALIALIFLPATVSAQMGKPGNSGWGRSPLGPAPHDKSVKIDKSKDVPSDAPRRLIVFSGGIEFLWGYLHPGGDALDDTYEAYGYTEGLAGLSDFNAVAEVLIAPLGVFEVGGHLGYNGIMGRIAQHGGARITSMELGGVFRYMSRGGGASEVGFRVEGGLMSAEFIFRGIADEYTTMYVRPAVSFGSGIGQAGAEVSFGWTYSAADSGLAPGDALPLGGLDLSILVRIAP